MVTNHRINSSFLFHEHSKNYSLEVSRSKNVLWTLLSVYVMVVAAKFFPLSGSEELWQQLKVQHLLSTAPLQNPLEILR